MLQHYLFNLGNHNEIFLGATYCGKEKIFRKLRFVSHLDHFIILLTYVNLYIKFTFCFFSVFSRCLVSFMQQKNTC